MAGKWIVEVRVLQGVASLLLIQEAYNADRQEAEMPEFIYLTCFGYGLGHLCKRQWVPGKASIAELLVSGEDPAFSRPATRAD